MKLTDEALKLISQFTLLFIAAWIVSTAMSKPVFRAAANSNLQTNGDGSRPLLYNHVRI